MILHSEWRDNYRPSRLDAAIDRGFDPGERPEPAPRNVELTPEWARGIEAVKHRVSEADPYCGVRCDVCNEHICTVNGPAHVTRCTAHPTCEGCDAEPVTCKACLAVLGARDFFEPWRHA